MRSLVVVAAIALSVGCATASSATRIEDIHVRVFCDLEYPWADGPLTKVSIRACFGWYEEARADLPGDLTRWSFYVDKVGYEEDGYVAVVTIGMLQSTGGKRTTFRRTYRFRWDGRAPALVRADPIVRSEEH